MTKNKQPKKDRPRCGICGKATKLKKTECCGQWVCDDWNPGSLPVTAVNSCSQNHLRLTLCGHHFTSKHPGDVNVCELCKNAFEEEIYTYLKTNEYNFNVRRANGDNKVPVLVPDIKYDEKVDRCAQCNSKINLVDDSYTIKDKDYFCEHCMPLF